MPFQPFLGLGIFILFAWLISEQRRRFPVRLVIIGLALQLLLAILLFNVPLFQSLFLVLNKVVLALESATTAGTSMVFGYLGGGSLPFAESFPGSAYVLAFRGLPLVLLISALSSLLFYWRVLPRIVQGCSWLLQKSMGIGGAEGLGVAANIFVGMVESPLIIRPYIQRMTRSELFTLMTCGMATIAGTVMVLYASILSPVLPDIMGHILIASLISAPASVVIAKIMVPETEQSTLGALLPDTNTRSSMDAITQGTVQGVQLLINIVAMIIVMVALIALINSLLGFFFTGVTLQGLLGLALAPVVWLLGIPWHEAPAAGELFGTKTVINEFVAYLNMTQLSEGTLSQRSLYIMSYALCGFANPGSLGIMIGGMGAMAPERRHEIVSLGLKSLLAGTLATSMTAAIAALMLPF
ncbi:concentrative nucleoside transporter, CNT family [Geoalkalibacter ferrihydriticus]|uniref:Nucleoside:proton symporter n=2 Tax=Geoalkalibacter ferrihydriticus TaxID=392333 RepID=A0A0C2DTU4_9BACT|nr:nucleoside transporter C-terminal domain-containing protein [Geoalkalibacter ferrihydriticus]KIH76874.1 nucleoside:proton symporter [Geoalkalibacter ferrihydriticus DSM 17813]SDL46654.1 concentrative nucleoside transporter, CNT family [Geoalkalibacter ferrihydriticus]